MLDLTAIRPLVREVVSEAIAPAKLHDFDLREIADSEGEAALEVRVASDPMEPNGADKRSRARLRLYDRLSALGEFRYSYIHFVGGSLTRDEAD